eukprot:TRINITY_DN25362_c0_g2_i1.p1 TRINITY_DN25362_c0_g2~~TRINITY_DN25362_c0_g2_i1.p1  ORF type:complete len:662 (-),score=78.52 TRINITY_DN25362_c0_g2_i1:67-2028(-)
MHYPHVFPPSLADFYPIYSPVVGPADPYYSVYSMPELSAYHPIRPNLNVFPQYAAYTSTYAAYPTPQYPAQQTLRQYTVQPLYEPPPRDPYIRRYPSYVPPEPRPPAQAKPISPSRSPPKPFDHTAQKPVPQLESRNKDKRDDSVASPLPLFRSQSPPPRAHQPAQQELSPLPIMEPVRRSGSLQPRRVDFEDDGPMSTPAPLPLNGAIPAPLPLPETVPETTVQPASAEPMLEEPAVQIAEAVEPPVPPLETTTTTTTTTTAEAGVETEPQADTASDAEVDPLDKPGVALFPRAGVARDVLGTVHEVLSKVPQIQRVPLATRADVMHGKMRQFQIDIGLNPSSESGTVRPITDLADPKYYGIGKFQLSGAEIKSLVARAKLHYVKGQITLEDVTPPDVQPTDPRKYEADSQLILLAGPVFVIFDDKFAEQEKAESPVIACSVPGINFAFSDADRSLFVLDESIIEDKALLRMKTIFSHVFVVMQQNGVEYPTINAFDCGAFKGEFENVPALWARALFEVLRDHSFGFKLVIGCLPTYDDDNFGIFCKEFEKQLRHSRLKVPVLFLEDKNMLTVADYLSRQGKLAGLLNPSDWQALRQGHVGTYVDGGHTAPEESLALQTTLFLQHVGINRDLYFTNDRKEATTLPTTVPEEF